MSAPAQQQQQPEQKLDGRPITAKESSLLAISNVRTVIFANIRDRCSKGVHFINVAERLPDEVVKDLTEQGYNVLHGKYATLIEWD